MKSVLRTLLYGIGIWFIWVSLVVAAFEALPSEFTSTATFVSMKMVTLVIFVLAFTVLYMRKVRVSSLLEGLLVGLGWTAIVVALDLAHYFMVPFNITQYFIMTVPTYIVIPAMTMVIMSFFQQKSLAVQSAGTQK